MNAAVLSKTQYDSGCLLYYHPRVIISCSHVMVDASKGNSRVGPLEACEMPTAIEENATVKGAEGIV